MISVDFKINLINHTELILRVKKKALFEKIDCNQYPMLREWFQRCSFDTRWKACQRTVFGRFRLGFRWCLAFSHPLPTSLIFVFV